MLRWFEHKQVYHPTRDWDATPADVATLFEDVYFTTTDGVRLNAWHFPANPNSPRAKYAVLVCHGNGGNLSHRVSYCRLLLALGVSVFIFDYCGYGRSQGKPTEEGTYLDALAAHHWLCDHGYAQENIIALGKSLGGAIATELALRQPIGALVLQSAFTSIADVGVERFPWLPVRRLHKIKYETLKKLPALKIPVLILHARDDETIPFHHAQRNFAVLTGPKHFAEVPGPHNFSKVLDTARHAQALEKFLQHLEQRQSVRDA